MALPGGLGGGTQKSKDPFGKKMPKSFRGKKKGKGVPEGTAPYTPHQATTNPTGPAPYADDVGH
jgi:hypothetical protein